MKRIEPIYCACRVASKGKYRLPGESRTCKNPAAYWVKIEGAVFLSISACNIHANMLRRKSRMLLVDCVAVNVGDE